MARIEYVGHATVLVDLDGVRLLTDPLLRNRVAHLRRVAPLDARSRRGVDAVLISHAHYDHLDIPSLEKLGKSLPVVVPRGLAGLLRFEGMGELAPVDIALIPIWGWGPGLGAGHLDPKRAAAAVALVRPELVVPIHWGTYFPIHLGLRGAPDFIDLPPAEFVTAVQEIAPGVPVRVLRPGQSIDGRATLGSPG